MFILGNLLVTVAQLLNFLLGIYIWIIIVRTLLSWINPDPYNRIVRVIVALTEPVLSPVRQRMPFLGGLDLSPLIVIILVYFIRSFVVKTLIELAYRIQ